MFRPWATLTNRIFLSYALMIALLIVAATLVVNERVTRQAEDQLVSEILRAQALFEETEASLFQQFIREGELIADLPKLKAAVATGDAPTVAQVAVQYQQLLRSDVFTLTDRRGVVLFAPDQANPPGAEWSDRSYVRDALAGRTAMGIWQNGARRHAVIAIPIEGALEGELLGSLTVGFRIDGALAERMKRMTESDIAFLDDHRTIASTLPAGAGAALWTAVDRLGLPPRGSRAPVRVPLDGEDYLVMVAPIAMPSLAATARGAANHAAPDDRPAGGGPGRYVVLRSRTEQLRVVRGVHEGLALAAVLGTALAIVLSYMLARTVTRPLGALTAAMRETARTGDLTQKIALKSGDEEARLLARTFNAMTDSIARFQRDARVRDRLSSLGKLSTVVAHEVRNPLMIIRGAVRALRSDRTLSAEAHDAATDIDGEVDRLNRIVADVLDYARPIRFDFAPADLNRICRDSLGALEGDAARTVGMHLAPDVPPIVTDADRLRQALMNLLVNARQALAPDAAAAGGATVPPPPVAANGSPIEVRTERVDARHVAVHVCDRGAGIAPEDLPSVFDPFFTTKRSGTGLGLAIVKNIVEGLGGAIGVASERGVGTEITITLAVEPPAGGTSP